MLLFIHSNFTASGSRIFSLHLYSRKRFSLFLIGQPLNDVPLSTRAQQLTNRVHPTGQQPVAFDSGAEKIKI
jgi:hypothetical protein